MGLQKVLVVLLVLFFTRVVYTASLTPLIKTGQIGPLEA